MSLFSTEAEYLSLARTAVELAWLRQLLKDIGIFLLFPPLVWCHYINALHLAFNPIFHHRSKHIEIHYHFILERVVHHYLLLRIVPSEGQLLIFLPKVSWPFDSIS